MVWDGLSDEVMAMRLTPQRVGVGVALGMLLLGGPVVIHYVSLDGLDGLFFASVLREDTEYAPRYSHQAFRRVHPGMPSQRVLELLGEPLERTPSTNQRETWRYSRSPSDSHYRLRAVQIAEGSVVGLFHEFYVD